MNKSTFPANNEPFQIFSEKWTIQFFLRKMHNTHFLRKMHIQIFCENWTIQIFCEKCTIQILCENWTRQILCENWTIQTFCEKCTIQILCENWTRQILCENWTIQFSAKNAPYKFYAKNCPGDSIIKKICQAIPREPWFPMITCWLSTWQYSTALRAEFQHNLRLHLIDLSRRLKQDPSDDVADCVLYCLQQVVSHLWRI